MASFVIEYNRRTRARHVTEFATSQEAVQYRLKLEGERTDRDVEIASLSSNSLETLKQTHSRYFLDDILHQAPNPRHGIGRTTAPAAASAADQHRAPET